MSTVLIVNHEALTGQMTGPTIRNWELARVLSPDNNVTLAVPAASEQLPAPFSLVRYDVRKLKELVELHEVVICSGYLVERHPFLADARYLVVDIYDPFPLENLHMHKAATLEEQSRVAAYDRGVQTGLVQRGDLFLCASARQRDFWTGWLAAVGRVNPYVHAADPSVSSLIEVVPFGISQETPQPGPPVFRGAVPEIGKDDFLVIWGGGIWNWFDPLTLLHAVNRTKDRVPQLRLAFPAIQSPSEAVLPMRMAEDTRRLSDQLGLTDNHVFFGKGWVPYERRGAMLLEADLGVSLHRDDIETRFSFRTRILDYLWAGLPVLTTRGDSMADLVEAEDLGAVVDYEDVAGTADALRQLAEDRDRLRQCARRSRDVARRFRWPEVARPLRDYCRAPRPAPDHDIIRAGVNGLGDVRRKPRSEARRVASRTWEVLRGQGPGGVFSKGRTYLKRLRS